MRYYVALKRRDGMICSAMGHLLDGPTQTPGQDHAVAALAYLLGSPPFPWDVHDHLVELDFKFNEF